MRFKAKVQGRVIHQKKYSVWRKNMVDYYYNDLWIRIPKKYIDDWIRKTTLKKGDKVIVTLEKDNDDG